MARGVGVVRLDRVGYIVFFPFLHSGKFRARKEP